MTIIGLYDFIVSTLHGLGVQNVLLISICHPKRSHALDGDVGSRVAESPRTIIPSHYIVGGVFVPMYSRGVAAFEKVLGF